jgi:flagellar hook-length control protein FliK
MTLSQANPAEAATVARSQEHAQAMSAHADRALAAAMRQGGGTLTMQVVPQHLGPLHITMRVTRGEISARMTVPSEEARGLLAGSVDALRRSLEGRGLRVQRLDVALAEPARGAAGGSSEMQARRGEAAQPEGGGVATRTRADTIDAVV